MPEKEKVGDALFMFNGRYKVLGSLGSGAQGQVKQGVDLKTNTKVALKICNGTTEAAKMKDLEEVALLKRLKHPNVVKLLNAFREEEQLVIVLEQGTCDLFDVLEREKTIPEHRARFYFRQIIDALEYTHKHKICHRDLKPENLLLCGEPETAQVKICDFGLSTVFVDENGKDRLLKSKCGTVHYLPHEIFGAKKYLAKPVDIWSCGIILYNMITGHSPWKTASMDEVAYRNSQLNKSEFWRWTNKFSPQPVGEDLQYLFNIILQHDPEKRATIEEIRTTKWYRMCTSPPLSPFPGTGSACSTNSCSTVQASGRSGTSASTSNTISRKAPFVTRPRPKYKRREILIEPDKSHAYAKRLHASSRSTAISGVAPYVRPPMAHNEEKITNLKSPQAAVVPPTPTTAKEYLASMGALCCAPPSTDTNFRKPVGNAVGLWEQHVNEQQERVHIQQQGVHAA